MANEHPNLKEKLAAQTNKSNDLEKQVEQLRDLND